ncbi:O-methyltransferase [Gordonia soli]|uniref:Methyltransferase n=1 Tax=Gordonia soli NBRC 108243 TaxID=1223545 RepID=M0QI72_9ACTN|nr:class I SAM-dependent methyltransferase [Gordonia soli]GAC67127.1 hypothetical protein GS4_05_03410 [Gordonia soli NBRC 108243]
MATTLDSEPVAGTLERLYAQAEGQVRRPRSDGPRPSGNALPLSDTTQSPPLSSAQRRADDASESFMAIGRDTGRLLYSLVRATRPTTVVEFGTSFGLSTIHLAAALRDNGGGHIHTTELSASKVAAASATFTDVGLADLITVHAGDALETLADIPAPIDFVVLDGWKDLYLPVIRLLEPRLASGTLILADNAESPDLADYLEHVRDPANGYTSVNLPGKVGDTVELSGRA